MSNVNLYKKKRYPMSKYKKVPKATKSYVDKKIKSNIDKEEDDLTLTGATISTTSGVSDISAGIALNNPSAKLLEIKNHSLRFSMRLDPQGHEGTYRIVIFKWKGDTAHYSPTSDDILLNEDVISPYVKQDLRSNFTILFDKVYTHGGSIYSSNGNGSDFPQKFHLFNFYKRLGNSQFNPIFTNGQGSNHIFFLIVGSQAVSTTNPIADIHVRSVYSKL